MREIHKKVIIPTERRKYVGHNSFARPRVISFHDLVCNSGKVVLDFVKRFPEAMQHFRKTKVPAPEPAPSAK
jgi:hypothetical protein